MKVSPLFALLLLALWPTLPLRAKEPEPRREQGLSAHLLPQQLTDLQRSRQVAPGFLMSVPGDVRPANARPSADSVPALIAFYRQQPAAVQQNGLWLVLTYSKAYSTAEKDRVRELKAACQREKIPLFMCRDNELPKGWKRFSRRSARVWGTPSPV